MVVCMQKKCVNIHVYIRHPFAFISPPFPNTTGKSSKPIREFFGYIVDILHWKNSAESLVVFLVSGQSSTLLSIPSLSTPGQLLHFYTSYVCRVV